MNSIYYYSLEILGHQTHFMRIGDRFAWLAEIDGKGYGDFVIENNGDAADDVFRVLAVQARESLATLKI